MEKISIIVPVYNAEEYLAQCLDSICRQSYQHLEILCINGNSEDRSGEILRRYEASDTRIRIIDKENEGVSLSRNAGLDNATGDYVVFVDADDWIDKDMCIRALRKAKETDADIVMWSYMREFGGHSLPKKILDADEYIYDAKQVRQKLHRRYIGLLGEELAHVEAADSLCPVWGKLYRRSIIEEYGIRFVDIRKIGTYEDGLFNLAYTQYVKNAVYVQQYWYHYRKDNPHSITSRYKPQLYRQWQNLFDYMETYICERHLGDEYTQALQNRVCLSVLGQGLNLMAAYVSPVQKIRTLHSMLGQERYKNAYRSFTLRYLPIHWKVFYGCAKYRFTVGVYLLLVIITKKIGTV